MTLENKILAHTLKYKISTLLKNMFSTSVIYDFLH